jgi:hypothetical protein
MATPSVAVHDQNAAWSHRLFFLISLVQIAYLHWRIEQSPKVDLHEPLSVLAATRFTSPEESTQVADKMAMTLLEANALDRRYHQASVALMARVWTSYLGVVTGMVLAIMGAVFILGRVQGTPTNLEAKVADAEAALKTSAPGIVLAAMGVLLMIETLFIRWEVIVSDVAVYSRSPERGSKRVSPGKPTVDFPR